MLIPLAGGTFPGWPAAEQPSVIHWLLLLVGIPVASALVIGVVAGAAALARRGRGEQQFGDSVWYGEAAVAADGPRRELTDGSQSAESTNELGGTSVRW